MAARHDGKCCSAIINIGILPLKCSNWRITVIVRFLHNLARRTLIPTACACRVSTRIIKRKEQWEHKKYIQLSSKQNKAKKTSGRNAGEVSVNNVNLRLDGKLKSEKPNSCFKMLENAVVRLLPLQSLLHVPLFVRKKKQQQQKKIKTGHGGEERSSFSGHLAAKSPSDGLQGPAEIRPGTLIEEDRKQAPRWKDTSRGTLHTWRQTGPRVEQHHTVGDVEHTFPCS